MMTKKRLTALLLAGVLALTPLTGCQTEGTVSSGHSSSVVEVDLDAITDICQFTAGMDANTVVATVDGVDITANELLYWVALCCDDILEYYSLTEVPWDMESDGRKLGEYILEDALQGAVTYHIVEKKAQEEGLSVSQDEMDTILQTLKSITADQEKLGLTTRTYLWQFMLTSDLYVWYCQCEYLSQALADKRYGVTTSGYPTDNEILAYLEDELGLYSTKHILLATKDLTTYQDLAADEIAKKKAKAEDILKQLRDSDDPVALFDTLMKQNSEDPGLVSSPDGYLGVMPGAFDSAYEQAAVKLEEGQISDVVQGDSGFHIILRLPLGLDPADYRESFIDQKMLEERDGWLEAADIQVKDAYKTVKPEVFYDMLKAYRSAVEKITE